MGCCADPRRIVYQCRQFLRAPGKRRDELEVWIETDLSNLFFERILPVTRSVAERWGVLEGQRQLAGRPLNMPDGQIAATALEHRLTLVTRNVKDFAGLGVTIFNPWPPLASTTL
jgi:predicted nucleic acid-binding protein